MQSSPQSGEIEVRLGRAIDKDDAGISKQEVKISCAQGAGEAGEMAQQLRVLAAPAEDWSSVLSTHTRQLRHL